MRISSHPAFCRMRSLTSRRARTNNRLTDVNDHSVVRTAGPLSIDREDILIITEEHGRAKARVCGLYIYMYVILMKVTKYLRCQSRACER